MSAITTHVLDTALGLPARDVAVELEFRGADDRWQRAGQGRTDADGRLRTLLPQGLPLVPGVYRLCFNTAAYFAARGTAAFYPEVQISFTVADAASHFHVPLLLSPFGYSTYRGS